MLQLTKRTEYGLMALVHMVNRPGVFVSAREIVTAYHVPKRLLAEVLKTLARGGLLLSQRGAAGGYRLVREPELMSVAEAVSVLEGGPESASCSPNDPAYHGLPMHPPTQAASTSDSSSLQDLLPILATGSTCDMSPTCPIKTPIQRLRDGIWSLLQRTSLRDLAAPTPESLSANPFDELLSNAQSQTLSTTRSSSSGAMN
jgi:Rrf2 family protein